jgi:hypothetical protein
VVFTAATASISLYLKVFIVVAVSTVGAVSISLCQKASLVVVAFIVIPSSISPCQRDFLVVVVSVVAKASITPCRKILHAEVVSTAEKASTNSYQKGFPAEEISSVARASTNLYLKASLVAAIFTMVGCLKFYNRRSKLCVTEVVANGKFNMEKTLASAGGPHGFHASWMRIMKMMIIMKTITMMMKTMIVINPLTS